MPDPITTREAGYQCGGVLTRLPGRFKCDTCRASYVRTEPPVTAADLQQRIDRTVAYLRRLLAGPLEASTAMVAEAAIEGLVRP